MKQVAVVLKDAMTELLLRKRLSDALITIDTLKRENSLLKQQLKVQKGISKYGSSFESSQNGREAKTGTY